MIVVEIIFKKNIKIIFFKKIFMILSYENYLKLKKRGLNHTSKLFFSCIYISHVWKVKWEVKAHALTK
jgi:hypothetical protein